MAEAGPIDRAALERLCAHHGIGTDYHDIWGHRHPVAPANLAALLAAFGVDLQNGNAGAKPPTSGRARPRWR